MEGCELITCKSSVITDMKGLDLFIKECIKLSNFEVDTGFGEEIHDPSGLKTSELSWILENGADIPNGEIPPRQFIESTNDMFEIDNMKVSPLVVKNILYKNADPMVQLKKIGNKQKQLMKQIMEMKIFPNPNNAPSVIRQKGRDDALIDTGTLKDSIQVWVENKKGLGSIGE